MRITDLKYTNPNTFEYQGKRYSLEHLQPLQIMIKVKGKDVPVKVEFGTHVFTEKYDINIHDSALQIHDISHQNKNSHHYRAFSIERYGLSLNLPTIFKKITQNTKFYNLSKNKCLVRYNNYYIFFVAFYSKHTNTIKILVQSAYSRTLHPRIISTQSFEKLLIDLQK